MTNKISNYSKKVFDVVTKNMREDFNRKVLDATFKAQKKYGFKIGNGEHSTWNNGADAFKHAYLSWYLTHNYGEGIAKLLGDMNEDERRRYSTHYTNYKNRIKSKFPTEAELQENTLKGELIYVENYTRSDGTKVSGYYRKYPEK